MWIISVEGQFSAAHRIIGYQGNCESLHGHNYKVKIFIEVKELDNIGLGIDFCEAKRKLNEITSLLDHKNLNELKYFKNINPSTENIAKFIYENLKLDKGKLKEVEVCESEGNCVKYNEG